MVRQHEEERNRLWRELHDETAQVLAALNMQLGMLQERADETFAPALDRAKDLLGEGIRSIRSVTRNLRPMALDDLGLVPSLRALVRDFQEQGAIEVGFTCREVRFPPLAADAEVALYRTLQEALANAVRHAGATRVEARLQVTEGGVELTVEDDGKGFSDDDASKLRSRGGWRGSGNGSSPSGVTFRWATTRDGGARGARPRPHRHGSQAG